MTVILHRVYQLLRSLNFGLLTRCLIWGAVSDLYVGRGRNLLLMPTPTSAQRGPFKKCRGELSLLAPIELPEG